MTIRQAKRTTLASIQDAIKAAVADIGKEYGLKVQTRPTAVGARKATLQVTLTAAPTATHAARADRAVKVDKTIDDRKIVVLVDENPYRSGTKAAATFELMKRSGTVSAFHEAVAKSRSGRYIGYYLNWALKPHGNQPAFIKLQ